MAKTLVAELPPETVKLVLTNVGVPQNIRAAMGSFNAGPHMGFIRLQLTDAEHRKASQAEIAERSRAILRKHYPGVEFLQAPGGLVASVFANGYRAPLALEVREQARDPADLLEEPAGLAGGLSLGVPQDAAQLHIRGAIGFSPGDSRGRAGGRRPGRPAGMNLRRAPSAPTRLGRALGYADAP